MKNQFKNNKDQKDLAELGIKTFAFKQQAYLLNSLLSDSLDILESEKYNDTEKSMLVLKLLSKYYDYLIELKSEFNISDQELQDNFYYVIDIKND